MILSLLLLLYVLINGTLQQNATPPFMELFDPSPTCISSQNYAFFCTRLERLENIQTGNRKLIKTYIGLNHTFQDENYHIIYRHIGNTAKNQDIPEQTTCFLYPFEQNDDYEHGGSIQYTLYNRSNTDIQRPISSITLYNIGLIMPLNEASETIYATFTDNILSIDYPSTPIAQISAYISNTQCIEILFLIPTNDTTHHLWYIEGTMWRTTDIAVAATNTQSFTTQEQSAIDDDIVDFNSMYCFQEPPEPDEQLAFTFNLADYNNNELYTPSNDFVNYDLLITVKLNSFYLDQNIYNFKFQICA